MAPINPPQYLQAGTYSARSDRLLMAASMSPNHGVGPLAMRSGVRPTPGNAGLAVAQRTTPAMFVTIADGMAWIQSSSISGGGYMVVNDAPQDVAITAAHATLGRRDLIIARVYDAEISGSSSLWTLEVVTGTPSASPAVPATPSGALPLATIVVNAAASTIVNGNITDSRVYTTSLGGTIPAPAASLPANPYRGMAAYDTTSLKPTWYNGTAWQTWTDDPLTQGIIRCTSSTRPGSPVEGMHIYETNTQRLLYYRSSAWTPVAAGTQPMAILRGISTVALPAGVQTAIPFSGEDLDNYSGHDTVTNNSRYTCQMAGYYRVNSTVGVVGAGTAEISLRLNGSTSMSGFASGSTTGDRRFNGTWTLFLSVGNYIETTAYAFEATNNFTSGSATMSYIEWIAP